MNRKRISLGHNLFAFDERPDGDDDDHEAGVRAAIDAYRATCDKRRAARDAGRAEVDHRDDFKSNDKPGAIDQKLGLDSAACLEFERLFGNG